MASGKEGFPKVIFVVPDGNRRHAIRAGLSSSRGHQAGLEAFKNIFDAVWSYDIEHFVFWALSSDNLVKRSFLEIKFLLSIFSKALDEVEQRLELDSREICFHAIGEWRETFPKELCAKIDSLQEKTKKYQHRHFTLLLAYDGKRELMRAVEEACAFPPFIERLASGYIPDVDLYIRTGAEGDPHLSSGALMLQMANAQLAFTKTLWPDFTRDEFDALMQDFRRRERRIGK